MLRPELPQQAPVMEALSLFWSFATPSLAPSPTLATSQLPLSHLLITVCFGGFWEASPHRGGSLTWGLVRAETLNSQESPAHNRPPQAQGAWTHLTSGL